MTTFVTLSVGNIASSGDGYDFTSDQETVTILANVLFGSTGGDGVVSNNSESELINYGIVIGGFNDGVTMAGPDATVLNQNGATITAINDGVVMVAYGNESFTNRGTISAGGAGVSFTSRPLADPETIVFHNYGSISGFAGVEDDSHTDGGSFFNAGLILGRGAGFVVSTNAGLTTDITNAAGGTIEGLHFAIFDHAGALHLTNYGTVIGEIFNQDGADDTIINRGRIAGIVDLGDGNSLFDGRGGTSHAIFAGAGDNRIFDGNGTVVVHVGSGNNSLTGGPGSDRFVFESALAGQVDRITGFAPGVDKLVLSQTDFTGIGPVGHALAAADFRLGAHAVTAAQHILYDPASGFLYYDADGNGPTARMHFATLSAHLALTHADFLVVA
jgi:Ca2+-binding RTX toxin-like protein